ncbi:type I-E CRISPR-associated protein Cas7/Cse4/CasC [Formicincola oecophyllae]|uniref:Type I-E CRISPR-associated protein Cas7/Cse4/CasC n=1 Tax=Formicincola oecophyllae TaxID=2558361 RepID=A0A4Y6UAC6_9PROT|nr:type I-E CRISPR-associated protein Cas7/Cse4/CasC [Formicincola oecophyllae]QDH13387.1 type I-E CRISPR-associated protein Cas7/Cse4/CasC [Formicincola oecophyllae]
MNAIPRFLQIHTLHNYTGALLNRDDSGWAKRLPYGDAVRTRISSQCLKRHWRMHEGLLSLRSIDALPHSLRSREFVKQRMRAPLNNEFKGEREQAILNAVEDAFQKAIYGEKGTTKTSRQPLLLGVPEVEYLTDNFAKIARAALAEGEDAKGASKRAEAWCKDIKKNLATLRENTTAPAGLAGALFGRMVTSDPAANIDAPIYVAHAFTTHAAQDECDYFTVVDDLMADDDTGAGHINETELTSGLFYGYVVVDVRGLIANLTGKKPTEQAELAPEDRELAGEVVRRLIHSIAEVSPGAKLGSTAPFGYASTVMVEAGDRQPRSLAGAFRRATQPDFKAAEKALAAELQKFDENYATGEKRRFMNLNKETQFNNAERASMPAVADWAKSLVVGHG